MDIDKIFSLIDKAEKSTFDRIKIQMEDVKLTLERSTGKKFAETAAVTESTRISDQEVEPDDMIIAPISGVLYIAREPGEEPYVREGSRVKKGDPVCIIEAMKTMNEISAPKSGIIGAVLKKDSQTVSANEPIFRYAKEK